MDMEIKKLQSLTDQLHELEATLKPGQIVQLTDNTWAWLNKKGQGVIMGLDSCTFDWWRK